MTSDFAVHQVDEPGQRVQGPCPVRVLAVIPSSDHGNPFVFVEKQVESLRALGISMSTFYLRSRAPSHLVSEYRQLRREISEFRPDLVHAHYGTATAFVCALASDVPLVVTFRGSDLLHNEGVGHFRFAIAMLLSQVSTLWADAIICVSRQLRDRLWWGHGKVQVIPTGVRLELFQPMPQTKARLALGYEANEKIVLMSIGGEENAAHKGFPIVEEAVRIAQEAIGPVRLVLLSGSCPSEQVPMHIAAADCVALASRSEGSPNIVKEALACNVPVVAVDVGDVRERLRNVWPSKIVARQPAAFAAGLVEVLAAGTRSNGRTQVVDCDEKRIAEAIRNLYISVCRNAGKDIPSASL